jgi:hypothetical protein
MAEAAKLYDADSPPPASSAKEIDTDEFAMQCKCPRCGFEFDPPKA